MSKQPAWTKEEEKFMRNNWGKFTPKQMAKKLSQIFGTNRTENSVIVKSKRIKLGPIQNKSCFTKHEICDLLGTDHRKVERWISAGLLKAKVAKTQRIKGKSRGIIEVKPSELLRFLKDNQDQWDSRVSGDIIKMVRQKELFADKVKIQRVEGMLNRYIPEHLKSSFAFFVATVAWEVREKIRSEIQEPGWLTQKKICDQTKQHPREGLRWTLEEDQRLAQLYKQNNQTYKEIGLLLGRSAESVERRLSRINIWGITAKAV